MRIGLIQTDPAFGDVRANLATMTAVIDREEADLWVLPELFATGYQFASAEEIAALSEPVPGGITTRTLEALTARSRCHIVGGLPEASEGRFYNSAVLVGPDGLLSCYRKIHLFGDEKRWFSPGDRPFSVTDIGVARVGMMICFDHLFPESARTLALCGADVIAHPANLVMPVYAQLTMRARALENGVFTVTANRIGLENRTGETLRYTGNSQIVSPVGEILARSPADKIDVRIVEVEPAAARDKALNPNNDRLADRRPAFYTGWAEE